MAFSNQLAQSKVYEFGTVTVVESLIKGGLGRWRMISNTKNVSNRQATAIKKEDVEKEKSKKSRSEIRIKAFE